MVVSRMRWPAALVALVLLGGCGGSVSPPATTTTSVPAPATPTAAVVATARSTAPATVTNAATASPATATPPTTPRTATVPAGGVSSPTAGAGPIAATLLHLDGQPVTQLAIADAGHRYATTPTGLYALTGDQIERRGGDGAWPNLVAGGPTTLVSGDSMSCGRGDGGAAMRRSVDGGRTWQPVQVLGGRGSLLARPVPTLGSDLFAVACDGLYRSTDSGGVWSRLPVVEAGSEPVDVAATPDGSRLLVVALVGEGGTTRLLASERQGDGWAPPRVLRDSWGSGVVSVGVEGGRPIYYFGTPLGLEVSRDSGTTWSTLNSGLDTTRLLGDPRAAILSPADEAKLKRGVGVYSIAARPDRPPALLGGGDGVYRLTGAAWQRLPVLTGQIVREVFRDLDGTPYARTDAGVHRLAGV